MYMTAEGVLALQRAGARHVGISLTKACPMACTHCAAATLPARDHAAASLATHLVERFASEMLALAAEGVRRVSLTGGEPLLALESVVALSRAALDAGLGVTVVTGLFWATSDAGRRRVLEAVPPGVTWNVSWDGFHARHVRIDHLMAVVEALLAQDADVVVRIAVEGADDPHPDLVRAALPNVAIAVQPVIAVGRATPEPAERTEAQPHWPCLSTGPLVMPDGSARPCCSAMMEQPDHPFEARTAGDGLVALHRAWANDPLLALLRAIGFGPVLTLLREIAPNHPAAGATAPHPCDLCAEIFSDPPLAAALAARVRDPILADVVRAAAQHVFVEPVPRNLIGATP